MTLHSLNLTLWSIPRVYIFKMTVGVHFHQNFVMDVSYYYYYFFSGNFLLTYQTHWRTVGQFLDKSTSFCSFVVQIT